MRDGRLVGNQQTRATAFAYLFAELFAPKVKQSTSYSVERNWLRKNQELAEMMSGSISPHISSLCPVAAVINAASTTITHASRQANKRDWMGYATISIQQATIFHFFFPPRI